MNRDTNYGQMLLNRYQLADIIGEGAMGKVYRAKDTLLGGVIVAVKFLSQTLLKESMRERFEREATICALLGEKSMNVVKVRDYGVDERNNMPFYVMEFLAGENLSEAIQYHPLSVSRFLPLIRQVCLGMEAAHEGILFKGELCRIIHRDIKPGNILVVQDSMLGELVKILDFGIAKLVQPNSSQTQSFMGTLAYCSPEQIEGKALDNRSDIYSLGIMMYELLTGEMPLLPETSSFGSWYRAHREFFPEPFPEELAIPESLQSLVFQCIEKHPDSRPQSVGEILTALNPIIAELADNNNKVERAANYQPKTNLAKSEDSIATQLFESEEDYVATQIYESPSPPQPQAYKKHTTWSKPQSTPLPYSVKEKKPIPGLEELCLQVAWPINKPKKKIVFPRLISTSQGVFTGVCVMLDQQEVNQRKSNIRYNQFLFLKHPHPMVLWITVLYHPHYEPRWLQCYLDLKTEQGQKIARNLAENKSYGILLFSLENSTRCQYAISASVNQKNSQLLVTWSNESVLLPDSKQAKLSKVYLKREYEKLKPKILLKLKSIPQNSRKY